MKTFNSEQLLGMLKQGVKQLSLSLDDAKCEKLIDYLALLQKWNGVYNLTAVREPAQMVTQHLLDSLAALPAFDTVTSVLDVGSGGGLPGIALAIARTEMRVDLIDTVQKKTAFLNQVKAELGLGNVSIHTGRVEQLQSENKYEVITSRAFSDLSSFVSLSGHLLKEGGRFIAMKGAIPQVEIAQLPSQWTVAEILPLAVPGLQAERHLVIIQRSEV